MKVYTAARSETGCEELMSQARILVKDRRVIRLWRLLPRTLVANCSKVKGELGFASVRGRAPTDREELLGKIDFEQPETSSCSRIRLGTTCWPFPPTHAHGMP